MLNASLLSEENLALAVDDEDLIRRCREANARLRANELLDQGILALEDFATKIETARTGLEGLNERRAELQAAITDRNEAVTAKEQLTRDIEARKGEKEQLARDIEARKAEQAAVEKDVKAAELALEEAYNRRNEANTKRRDEEKSEDEANRRRTVIRDDIKAIQQQAEEELEKTSQKRREQTQLLTTVKQELGEITLDRDEAIKNKREHDSIVADLPTLREQRTAAITDRDHARAELDTAVADRDGARTELDTAMSDLGKARGDLNILQPQGR